MFGQVEPRRGRLDRDWTQSGQSGQWLLPLSYRHAQWTYQSLWHQHTNALTAGHRQMHRPPTQRRRSNLIHSAADASRYAQTASHVVDVIRAKCHVSSSCGFWGRSISLWMIGAMLMEETKRVVFTTSVNYSRRSCQFSGDTAFISDQIWKIIIPLNSVIFTTSDRMGKINLWFYKFILSTLK